MKIQICRTPPLEYRQLDAKHRPSSKADPFAFSPHKHFIIQISLFSLSLSFGFCSLTPSLRLFTVAHYAFRSSPAGCWILSTFDYGRCNHKFGT
ncbi:hypothetical protein SDJN03_22288, partial [Cucurbita argyrosperma subsp. sororia]